MSNVKNFGLIGVGSDLQFGKSGTRLINNAGTFNFKAANGTTDAALTAAGITTTGNVTLTTGNLALSASSGVISVGSINVLQHSAQGVPQISGTAGVVVPAGTSAQRGTGETGLVRVNTDVVNSHVVEFWDGDSWVTLATGGNTVALQTEIDNMQTALGAAMNANGTYNAPGFTNHVGVLQNPLSFTDAINQVAAAVAAGNTLDEILPGTNGQIIYNNNGSWATALPGSTSGVQGYDAGLAALASRTSTGILVQTGADTYESRTLVAPTAGITITNADGVASNPTFALANDLAAVEGLATIGYAVRTGDGTWTTRSIDGTAGNIVVTNVDGVGSNTNINLAPVVQANTGNFVKVTLDGFGRVIGNTPVVTADIAGVADSRYLRLDGASTMTGPLNMGNNLISGVATPVAGNDAANKNYVDSAVAGLSWKNAVKVATTGPGTLATSFENGDVIDGVTLVTGMRILIKDQTNATENGIYVVQATGAPVRSADADTGAELVKATVFVDQGTINATTGWTQTTDAPITLGTSNIVFNQFSGAGAYNAGTGLSLSGNTFNVNLGAGITELPGDEIGIDLVSNLALQLTGNAAGDQLTFVLAAGSGLSQSSAGLTIAAAGVTNAMLANSGFVINADAGGTDTVSLGQTLLVAGTSTQGITTNRSGDNTITISASNASASQKGVASFAAGEFVVTSGNVVLGTVQNSKLANSSITFAGNAGTPDAVALGETVTISSADSAITVTAAPNALSIQLNTVNVTHGGTGAATLTDTAILIGNGTSAVEHSAALTFNSATDVLTIGGSNGASITAAGGDVTIATLDTNADLVLSPNGTGQVVIGPAGAGVISADIGQALSIIGNNTLVLQSTLNDIVMTLPANTTAKVTVSGPTAAQYATSLSAEDLVNKHYVDNAIQTGAVSGSIKAVSATVNIGTTGTTNIGVPLPAGATVVRVKVQVTAADTGTGTLSVGVVGDVARYMTTGENDTQAAGLYLAETYFVNSGSQQVIATVAGSAASGSAVVFLEYQAP